MLKFINNANIFETKVEALVNTVNCAGVMGKGIALSFKQLYPDNFKAYKKACDNSSIAIGKMFVFTTGLIDPKYIVNFPTKQHWKGSSKIEYITAGLDDLKRIIIDYDIKSIAIPPLGCGNGGLDWQEVSSIIKTKLDDLQTNVDIYVLNPTNHYLLLPKVDSSLTEFRAVLIKSIQAYNEAMDSLYFLGNIEIQKLVYFINLFMHNGKLKYEKNKYGPYCSNLHNALDNMAGTFLLGIKNNSDNHISLASDAVKNADSFLSENNPELFNTVLKIKNLVDGYETPYGMELLATVHWVLSKENPSNIDDLINKIHSWNDRKKQIMSPEDIKGAYDHLLECDLVQKF